MQCRKYDGSNSYSQTLIIPRLPRFEKLGLSQFQLYIEAQTVSQCFVCCNYKNNILIGAAEGKDKFFCILHMLRIHTILRTRHKRNVFDLHIKNMNTFDIRVPCIKIAKSELLFEQNIMAINRDKYDIEVQNYDAIKRNQT